jgi:hypothetical protein
MLVDLSFGLNRHLKNSIYSMVHGVKSLNSRSTSSKKMNIHCLSFFNIPHQSAFDEHLSQQHDKYFLKKQIAFSITGVLLISCIILTDKEDAT